MYEPYGRAEVEEPEVPEPASTVDAVQVPKLASTWSWDPDKVVWVTVAVVGVGFGIWFLMQYSSAKAAAIAKAIEEAASNGS